MAESESDPQAYQPVPVDVARRISAEYRKDWVIVLAGDDQHNKIHSTTFARFAGRKDHTASLAELCVAAIGAGVAGVAYEDFRTRTRAEAAAEIAGLKDEVDRLKGMLAGAGIEVKGEGGPPT